MASDPSEWTMRARPHHGERGMPTVTVVTLNRQLASGRLDDVPLSEDAVVELLADLADALRIVRRVNRERQERGR